MDSGTSTTASREKKPLPPFSSSTPTTANATPCTRISSPTGSTLDGNMFWAISEPSTATRRLPSCSVSVKKRPAARSQFSISRYCAQVPVTLACPLKFLYSTLTLLRSICGTTAAIAVASLISA